VTEFIVGIDDSELMDGGKFTVAGVPVLDLFAQEKVIGTNFSSERVFGNTEEGITVSVGVVESKVFVHVGSPSGVVLAGEHGVVNVLPGTFEVFNGFNIFSKT